jgi:hypothetical protein
MVFSAGIKNTLIFLNVAVTVLVEYVHCVLGSNLKCV